MCSVILDENCLLGLREGAADKGLDQSINRFTWDDFTYVSSFPTTRLKDVHRDLHNRGPSGMGFAVKRYKTVDLLAADVSSPSPIKHGPGRALHN